MTLAEKLKADLAIARLGISITDGEQNSKYLAHAANNFEKYIKAVEVMWKIS